MRNDSKRNACRLPTAFERLEHRRLLAAHAVTEDGSTLTLSGEMIDAPFSQDVLLQRTDASGAVEASFGNNGKVWFGERSREGAWMDYPLGVAVADDGSVLLAYRSDGWTDAGVSTCTVTAVLLHADGSPDTSFGPAGKQVLKVDADRVFYTAEVDATGVTLHAWGDASASERFELLAPAPTPPAEVQRAVDESPTDDTSTAPRFAAATPPVALSETTSVHSDVFADAAGVLS